MVLLWWWFLLPFVCTRGRRCHAQYAPCCTPLRSVRAQTSGRVLCGCAVCWAAGTAVWDAGVGTGVGVVPVGTVNNGPGSPDSAGSGSEPGTPTRAQQQQQQQRSDDGGALSAVQEVDESSPASALGGDSSASSQGGAIPDAVVLRPGMGMHCESSVAGGV